MLDDLFEFLQGAVTPYHAAAIATAWLDAAGYTRLEEADYWNLEAGKGYYITRNGSSVIAWRVRSMPSAVGALPPATAIPRAGKLKTRRSKTTAAPA